MMQTFNHADIVNRLASSKTIRAKQDLLYLARKITYGSYPSLLTISKGAINHDTYVPRYVVHELPALTIYIPFVYRSFKIRIGKKRSTVTRKAAYHVGPFLPILVVDH